jgi:hypothetical protein
MATEVLTVLRDDLDGATAERTVSFTWDGASYEIDLSKKNIAELSAVLAPYVAAGRRSGGVGRRSGRVARTERAARGAAQTVGTDLAAVRSWAAANGHVVAARGRISTAVLDAFRSESGDAKPVTRRGVGKRTAAARKRTAKAPAKS